MMQRNLELYVAKRKAAKDRREKRRTFDKDAMKPISSKDKEKHKRRHSLQGALVVGSVSTTPLETATIRSGHHAIKNSHDLSSSSASQPSSSGGVGSAPTMHHRNSSRNLLARWSPEDLKVERPLKLFPTQEDMAASAQTESKEKEEATWKVLAQYQPYDRVYRRFLDPTCEVTKAAIEKMKPAQSTSKSLDRPLIVTPTLYLYLHLSLVDLHKISFLVKCCPVVEIYSLRGTRTQLLYESESAKEGCTSFAPRPILLKLDDVCYGQMERDILIRVTHVQDDGNRVLLGEHWTNLYTLQTTPNHTKVPLLRARDVNDAQKGSKEKGTLIVHIQDLYVRTSHGMIRYPGVHPNRLLPLTHPPIFERKTNCVVSLTPHCSHLHLLLGGNGTSSTATKKHLSKSGKFVPFLQLFRQEEDSTWTKKPVYTTEELLLTLSDTSKESLGLPSATQIVAWKSIQLPLFDLCFGDITRPILVKVLCAGMVSGPTLLSTFQFTLSEILGKTEPTAVVIDPRFGQPNATINNNKQGLGLHEVFSPTAGGHSNQPALTLSAADEPRSCIVFTRAHCYSSLVDMIQLVQRCGLAHDRPQSSPVADEPNVISGLHRILIDQDRRKSGQDNSATINFSLTPEAATPLPMSKVHHVHVTPSKQQQQQVSLNPTPLPPSSASASKKSRSPLSEKELQIVASMVSPPVVASSSTPSAVSSLSDSGPSTPLKATFIAPSALHLSPSPVAPPISTHPHPTPATSHSFALAASVASPTELAPSNEPTPNVDAKLRKVSETPEFQQAN